MTLIDTAELYGDGRSEKLIGRVIAGQRDRVFLVSKVWPSHATRSGIPRAAEASLTRLGTDHLDLYLLHWPSGITDFSGVVAGFETLRSDGRIRAWGVSNFKIKDMERLFRIPHGDRCATNQVLYNLAHRGIERDLLPWSERHGMPVMAYSPLGGHGAKLLRDPTLASIGAAHGCSAAAVALAWTMRSGNVIAIPESGLPAHVQENAVALSLTLTPQELQHRMPPTASEGSFFLTETGSRPMRPRKIAGIWRTTGNLVWRRTAWWGREGSNRQPDCYQQHAAAPTAGKFRLWRA